MSAIAQQKVLVKEGLFQFITKHIPSADINVIDDIVLTYVISILEEASQDPCFDVEGFIEMMSAYVPQFGHIDAGLVCTWVLELEAELNQRDDTDSLSNNDDSASSDRLSLTLQNLSEMLPPMTKNSSSRSHSNSESSESVEGNRRPLLEEDVHAEQCKALAEMFPNTCAMEIKHCVSIGHGDVERAAATLLHRREQGQSLSAAALHSAARTPLCDDSELKNRIIARYSYVDKNADQKEHKPLAPKIEPKKMVRYRDNKIVSLKGERYTEVPKSGVDEENLKKPKKHHCP
ncbi:CUE domain-containing protein 2 isoform X2 [Spodoptera frugiperda]|uniref:CUE domain-containing protein 2 isoform X1 n=1 Tax=Spodoptera frugiperda TaxID=7108 RepID=A0A9R0F0F6_SPOFR|nr:CUE domain-containing protein 2 isoform X1 [Spodoptera frugiperda]XP_050558035.1 CUE domain-containing protein 2 isoform X2 [Spodoptera frugiperda]